MARRNEIAREDVIKRIFKEEVLGTELLQVAGSKFMINANCNGEIVPIRVDLVAVKIDENDSLQFAEDFHDEYVNKEEMKRLDKEEKARQKEKKIARDKQLREEKRLAKEQAKKEKEGKA